MKKTINCIIGGLLFFLLGILIGYLIRQPEINKLKKLLKQFQKEIGRLQQYSQKLHDDFQTALLHIKALKTYQSIERNKTKENANGILVLQYGMKDYFELLLHRLKTNDEMEKEDFLFFHSFDKEIEGKKLSYIDKVIIHKYIMSRHKTEIKNLQECDCSVVIKEIETYKQSA